mgnify:CR=1 FL=1
MKTPSVWLRALCTAGVLLLPATPLAAQTAATLSGRVSGENGAPIAGASVFIAALGAGTVTRADGTYSFSVPAARLQGSRAVTLTAQRVGYRSSSVSLALSAGASLTHDFNLVTDVLELEGIVATGLGQTTTRERLGVSISSVSGGELTTVSTPNVVSALAARAPGVQVTTASGEPGAGAYIRIRGVSTIVGNGQPLFIVDGVPINNDEVVLPSSLLSTGGTSEDPVALSSTVNTNRAADLNPSDIASIEILKGAAASAVYGARAANGVVLITTKQGRPGQTRVSLTTTFTTDEVSRSYPLQRRWAQGANGVSDNSNLRSWGSSFSSPAYDHFGELFETGQIRESNLSISGGSDRASYYLALGMLDHDGVIRSDNDFFDRRSARLRASYQLARTLSVTGNFAYNQTESGFTQKGSNTSGLLLAGLRTPPNYDNCIPGTCYRTEDGFHRNYTNPEPASMTEGGTFDNPFWVLHENRARSDVGRAFGNVSVEYRPLDGLDLRYTLGSDYSSDERLDRFPTGNSIRATGYMQQGQVTQRSLDHNLVGNLTRDFGPALRSTLSLGWNRNARDFRRLFAEGFDFIALDLYTLDNVLTTLPDNYRYKLYRLRDARSAGLFFPLQENMALREHLYRRLGVDTSRLADKRKFYRACLEHGLPVAPTVAEFRKGELRWWPGGREGELPPRDLFSKPANELMGKGAARWFWEDGRYRGEDDTLLTGPELIAHLRALSRSAPYVLQVRLANHPHIAPLAPATLCTVRVVTHRTAGGAPEHLVSLFRMAGGAFAADNFARHGLASPVDAATGELRPAVLKDLHQTMVEHTHHPVFGSPIAGVRLPEWERVVELALRAHRVFHDFPSVGWDVAITPDGPVLIEGNYNWCVDLLQQATGRGLGETGFPASYLSFFAAPPRAAGFEVRGETLSHAERRT